MNPLTPRALVARNSYIEHALTADGRSSCPPGARLAQSADFAALTRPFDPSRFQACQQCVKSTRVLTAVALAAAIDTLPADLRSYAVDLAASWKGTPEALVASVLAACAPAPAEKPATLVVGDGWILNDPDAAIPLANGCRLAFESANGDWHYFGITFPDTDAARAFYLANPHKVLAGTNLPVPPELAA